MRVYKFEDLSGSRFGKWTVIERAPENRKGNIILWKCLCDCGKTSDKVVGTGLKAGKSTRCKSCSGGCKKGSINKVLFVDGALNILIHKYKQSALYRNYVYDLTKEEFRELIIQRCHYCGIEKSKTIYSAAGLPLEYNGIDRIDSKLGYVIENCVPCCSTCNFGKGTLSYEEFMSHLDRIRSFIPKRIK